MKRTLVFFWVIALVLMSIGEGAVRPDRWLGGNWRSCPKRIKSFGTLGEAFTPVPNR